MDGFTLIYIRDSRSCIGFSIARSIRMGKGRRVERHTWMPGVSITCLALIVVGVVSQVKPYSAWCLAPSVAPITPSLVPFLLEYM